MPVGDGVDESSVGKHSTILRFISIRPFSLATAVIRETRNQVIDIELRLNVFYIDVGYHK